METIHLLIAVWVIPQDSRHGRIIVLGADSVMGLPLLA